MIAFLTSFLLFMVGLAILLILGGVFVALVSGVTGILFGSIFTLVEDVWKRPTDNKCHTWTWWCTRVVFVSAAVWIGYAVHFAVTTSNAAIADARSWVTFGVLPPSESQKPVEVVKTEIRRYKLIDTYPPKHFYVTLEDVKTKQMYERTYVNKHCNTYASNKLGDEYNISITVLKQGKTEWMRFDDLTSVFCR
jgi:hypothetical protein